jgi:thioesterase domain-containing protein/acyl carrier protein
VQLVRIWEELLEPRPIGIRDNFFHLGGHSLLAGQLVYRIEQTFGTKIALSTLFTNPTVEQLAIAVKGDRGAEGKAQVLPVQVDGNRRPFFFLHGDWTGGAFYCFTLARACGTDQPFYALEPCSFSSDRGIPTLETVASAHVESVRAFQPVGPYRLGGFCNGGLLAYEMARQLEAAGEEVEFLGLINPSEPVQSSLLARLCSGVGAIGRGGEKRAGDLYLRTRHALRHLYRRLRPQGARVEDFEKLVSKEPRLAAMFPPKDALYADYVGVFSWAVAAYRTGAYGGKTTFLWAREEPGIAETWQPVVKHKFPSDIEEHDIDGTHISCVTDGVDDLAKTLSGCLGRLNKKPVYD